MEPKVRKQSQERQSDKVLVGSCDSWVKPHLKPALLSV